MGRGSLNSLNFEILHADWPELSELGKTAEQYVYQEPSTSLIKLRVFAEKVVEFLYYQYGLIRPVQANLIDLLNEYTFRLAIPDVIQSKLHHLRIKGNKAAHGEKAGPEVALQMVREGYDLGRWLVLTHARNKSMVIPAFREPSPTIESDSKSQLKREKKAVQEQLAALEAKYQQLITEVEAKRAQSPRAESTPDQLQIAMAAGEQAAASLHFDEEKTRAQLIDTWLMAAGWDPSDPNQVGKEVPVKNQPTDSGEGFADYVLWADNGKPLAVIEAKRTSKDPQVGRTQAECYAEGLRARYGQRPIIFCTNGHQIEMWDKGQVDNGLYDPARGVYGFYSKDSLEYLVFRARNRLSVKDFGPDTERIVDRLYQIGAVREVIERFANRRRRALIVQATGTGKTRVAIALSEALIRAKWARRILFLCDRRELRKQADDAFQQFLPGEPRTFVNAGTYKDREHRIYLATYPAMSKVYETFDVGFFDLVIADESHRSIYNRYRELFDHFDGLQVGLTATPTQFISRNTYRLFGCEDRQPTASYSLKQGIEAGYLVPPKVIDHTTAFLRDGIKYANLTEAQRTQLEEDEVEPEAVHYEAEELDKRVFNKDTNRIILQNLMEEGIRDGSGSLVGKTIVFARNHNHAVILEKLFDKLYPQHGSKVCRVIDHHDTRALDLIDEFKDPKSLLRIAISVDMLDTGIDVPEVVNLVFAKPVFSYVKFRQMIGRGTRLCPDLFGPGEDKTHFIIFDHWGNFARFEGLGEDEFAEAEPSANKSLLQKVFESRIALAEVARVNGDQATFKTAIDLISRDVADLPEGTIRVREKWRQLQEAKDPRRLEQLDPGVKAILTQDVAPLMQWRDLKGDHDGHEFDLLVSRLQGELISGSDKVEGLKDELLTRLSELPASLNQVRARAETIQQVRSPAFWENVTPTALEDVRHKLRSTMRYRVRPTRTAVQPKVIDIREEDDLIETRVRKVRLDDLDKAAYRSRVQEALQNIFDESETLQKIKAGEPVAESDLQALTSLVLTQEPDLDLNHLVDYYPETAGHLDLAIRRIIGLDAEAVRKSFERFVRRHPTLNSMQIRFLDMLQNYIAKYGAIELEKLYDQPFTTLSSDGIDGVFSDSEIDDLIGILETFQPPKQQGGVQ
jgi:type I restriction enzyme, R subunit